MKIIKPVFFLLSILILSNVWVWATDDEVPIILYKSYRPSNEQLQNNETDMRDKQVEIFLRERENPKNEQSPSINLSVPWSCSSNFINRRFLMITMVVGLGMGIGACTYFIWDYKISEFVM